MTKRILLSLLMLGFAASLTACGGGTHADEGEEQFADQGSTDFKDNGLSDASGEQAAGGEQKADELALDDQPQQAQGEGQPKDDLSLDDAGAKQADGKDELSLDDVPEDVAKTDQAPAAAPTDDALFQDNAAPPPPVAEQAPVVEAAPPPMVESAPPPPAPAAPPAPLQKIKDTAFAAKDGTLLNRVYVGRQGDTSKKISEKIYGDGARAKDLKSWNSILKKREVKVGDKVYYASTTNPTDQTMKTYYEDMGIPPQVHVTQGPDEDLKKLSRQFLGHKESWKEVWSTNFNIESKGALPAGTELKYWPESVVAAKPAPPPAAEPPPVQQPPVAAAPVATPDPLPPLPTDPVPPSAGTTNSLPPLATPEEKPVTRVKPPSGVSEIPTDDDTIMMAALAGLVLLAGALMFVVMRRNKSKKLDLGQTQI